MELFSLWFQKIGMKIGYGRVSKHEQHDALQRDELEKAGCERIFIDKGMSGKTWERPELDNALKCLRPGDILVVWKLDRLGRSLQHLIKVLHELEGQGVQFRSITEAIDTTTPGGKLIFHIMGALAEFERNLIIERTRAGLDAARARGHKGGPKQQVKETDIKKMKKLYDTRQFSIADICKQFGISRSTFYRYIVPETRKEGE